MGNDNQKFQYGSNYGKEWNGSLGDYTKDSTRNLSFNEAFSRAHSRAGNGHTFTWNGNLYSTNTKDGIEYRHEKNQDNRESFNHTTRAYFHDVNAGVKNFSNNRISLDKLTLRDYNWSSEVDRQRSDYHRRENYKNQNNNNN